MKKLTEIIDYNTSSALGWTLIHSIWQGFAILLVFGILYYFFKPSTTRYRLGIGALCVQFLAAIITFFTIYEPNVPVELANQGQLSLFFLKNTGLVFTPQKLSFIQQVELFLHQNLDIFVMMWFIGTSLLLLRLVVGFTHVQGMKIQQVKPVNATIQALMDTLLEKTQMPSTIKLLESARASVPMTIGWLRPVVLLPIGMATGLGIKQLEAILAHELAHIKRYDYLVNIFQNVIEILFFYHPATWFISGKVRDERENCCDDFAVEICGDSLVLAKALTQVASYQHQPHLAMAFGAKRQTFMDRIKRIIGINDAKPMSYGNWAAVFVMILVVALGVTYAQKEIKKEKKIEKAKKANVSINKLVEKSEEIQLEGRVIIPTDSSKLEEVEAEMEVLSKEMEKYSREMEVLSKQMDEKYARQMEKESEAMQQVQRKFQVPQRKIQDLSIQIQEVSLAMQKIHNKYMDSDRMPVEAEQKLKALEKQERVLEKQMQEVEQQMHSVEAEMRPFEQRMHRLGSPMDSLGRLMERYAKPMDSLGKIMGEKGRILEKLAKEEEARFKKDLEVLSEMLYKDGLIKNKKDFELRLKGDKLLIDLEPQSAVVYDKVWDWINKTWGSRYKGLKEKDFRINVNGDEVNFSTHGGRNYYHHGGTYPAPPPPPARISTPRASGIPAPPEPRSLHTPSTPHARAAISKPMPPKAPKSVKGIVD
ncbi:MULTISPECIES: M56 family metallopeptidase [Emticicia]|uniref:M56 family metallopeptidase n=1 Tax=Emticicia TaxID=312278 RepID=UPI0007D8C247|nr:MULTISPECIES: M56 family metallopeptidase [Emticicia]